MTDETPDIAPRGVKLAGLLVGITFVVTDLRGIFILEQAGADVLSDLTGQVGTATVLLALVYMAVLLGVLSMDWWGWWLTMAAAPVNVALAFVSPLGVEWAAVTVLLVVPVVAYLATVPHIFGVRTFDSFTQDDAAGG